jgi:alpha-galactosidase/6-phospho-beta-glucosidase family protein
MDNTIDQWARAALHATGHSDQQIEAMRKAKPKLAVYIPPSAESLAYAEQWVIDNNTKKAAAKVTTAHNSALDTERKRTMTYQERAEAAERQSKGLEAQVNGLLRGQRS